MNTWYGMMGYVMPLHMLVVWGLFIALLYLVFRSINKENTPSQSALEVAKRRYARGEITLPELNEIKKNL